MSREVEDLVNAFSVYPFLLYIRLSPIPLLVVDWLFALDIEIAHAWNVPWNLGRALYFVTRYTALVGVVLLLYFRAVFTVSPQQCLQLSVVCSSILIFGILVAECIMSIRVWALWDRSKWVGIFLLTMAVINTVVCLTTYILIGQADQYVVMDSLASIIPGCFPSSTNVTEAWSFIPLIVHQTLIFVLTAIKCIQHYRSGIYGTSLTNTFYIDGMIYYALLVALSVTNLAVNIPRSNSKIFPFPVLHDMQFALHSILSSRMLLHLRQESDSLHHSNSLASLRFAVTRDSSYSLMPSSQNEYNDDWFVRESSRHSYIIGPQVDI
ncbi:hypothetical protein BDZ94DRAFT_391898 [Collybia nuda]|uniref:DUF6533 domain-containing protein n=1 Tax=Collybia nuda TaxID=64659 RepID=A0A9P5YAL2_9AGAR|nr:hypothetical protein BDZ94DRAFT_391898 [Collybia nuda]